AGSTAPTRQGAGAAGAVPDIPPAGTSVPPPPAIGSSGVPGQVLVDKVTKPLPTGPVVGVPVPPPPGPQAPPPPGGGAQPRSGTIVVTPETLHVGAGDRATFTITAVGAPENWTAASSSGQLTLSTWSGVLRPGHSQTVVIALNRTGGGSSSAMVYVNATGAMTQAIAVDWAGIGARPSPSPTPTPVPTPTPTPAPTPSPSPSPSSATPSSSSPSPSATVSSPQPPPSPSAHPSPSVGPSPSVRPSPRWTPLPSPAGSPPASRHVPA
ncbi:MAG TPA: hypothetical protein VKU39_21430, partial [Streptosporangiaceae bacterium]|nr:hypothetical protein [Streptosporangiaceae bacterium]